MPIDGSPIELVSYWRKYMKEARSIAPVTVKSGPLLENVSSGKDVNIQAIPTPRWHAAVRAVDAREALALPGVQAVLTLDDLAPVLAKRRMLRHSNSGTPLDRYWSFALADGEVSYVGEAVALVIADDRYVAEDAAALVAVDYDVLPSVADCRQAVAPTSPAVRRELNTNVAATYKVAFGDVQAAFNKAAHGVVEARLWPVATPHIEHDGSDPALHRDLGAHAVGPEPVNATLLERARRGDSEVDTCALGAGHRHDFHLICGQVESGAGQ